MGAIFLIWILSRRVNDEQECIPADVIQHCYQQWKQRFRHRVASQVNYFNGDILVL
jgi:hypothetical protein